MSRLATEFQRLYAAGASGERRALVLDVGRPSDWDLLGHVWREVQLALSLPAPAIAQDRTTFTSARAAYRLVTLATGLVQPWSIALWPIVTRWPRRIGSITRGARRGLIDTLFCVGQYTMR